jgi:dienelactone hydrolase
MAIATPAAGGDIESIAKSVVARLVAGDYVAATAEFDDRMRAALTPEALARLWAQVRERAGAFRQIESTRTDPAGVYRIVFVTCAFEKERAGIKIVFDAGDRVAGLFVAPVDSSRPPAAPWSPPAYADTTRFEERGVTVESGTWKLPGVLAVPHGGGPFAAAILVHGSGPHDADETVGAVKPFRDLAWGLASRGVVVLRYTKRTQLLSQQETPSIAGLTVQQETIDDARAAVTLLARTAAVDPQRIWIVGHSLGGMLAPRIATQDRRVAGIAILAGNVRPLEDLVVEQIRFLAGRDGRIASAESAQIRAAERSRERVRDPALADTSIVDLLGAAIPGSYFLDLRGYRPDATAAALAIPVLVVQGGRDYQVGRADFERWQRALAAKRDATCTWLPELNHLFVAGSGASGPEEYGQPGHVDGRVVDILTGVCAGGR